MRKAVDAYRGMVEKDLVPAGAASDNGTNFLSFTNGKIGQQSLGAFAIGTLVTQHPDIDFGVTLIPGIEGGPSSFAGGDNFVITKGSEQADAGEGIPRIRLFARGPEDPRHIRQPADARRHRRRGAGGPRPAAAGRPWTRSAVAKTPYTLQFNDLINSANGPWASFTNAAIFGDDVDGAFAQAQSEMQSIIDMRPVSIPAVAGRQSPPGQSSRQMRRDDR